MPVSRKDGRRLTGYIGDINPVIDNDEELPDNQYYEEEEEEEIVEEVEEDQDDTGSELSIPDAEIDFDMVYALYTFAATVEGQASIVKGDALTLLDDSNSYWWLVKVLKTAEVGYIPAEIIETPYERLARLNSHRNAQLTRPENIQAIIQTSTTRKTPKAQKRVTLAKAVQFQSQIMFNLDDDEEEFEVEYNDWQIHIHHDDDEDDSESDSEESTSTIGSDPDPYHFYGDEEDEEEEMDGQRKQEGEVVQNQQENDYPIFNSPVNEEFDTHLTPLKDTAEEESELKVNNNQQQQQQQQQQSINNDNHNNTSNNNNYQHQHQHHTNNNSSNSSNNNTQSVIKIYASHDFKESNFIEFIINNHTTTNDLIDQAIESFDIYDIDEKDYFLGVKSSMSGDDYTLIPTDKPLDIYHSLGTNTPMPNLKKAKRISQMMTPDGHIGSAIVSKEQDVKFYLYSKPRRMEDDGEIQIKVSLDNFHKSIKITPTIPVNEATGFLLEKFHVLDGLAVGSDRNSLGMGSQDVVTYQLYLFDDKKEYALPSSATLAEVLGNQMPPIQYRRHSNLNRLSIAMNINPPNENETYFILKPIQKPSQKSVEKTQQLSQQQDNQPQHQEEDDHQQKEEIQQEEEDHQQQNLQQQQNEEKLNHQQLNHEHVNETSTPVVHHRPVRHDTPMPRRDNSPIPERSISDKPPQIVLTSESPIDLGFESPEPIISNKRPQSTNSMIFHNDFGMHELMILIRERSRPEPKPRKSTVANLRGEITHVFKESHGRLDQLEKELDDILAIAINMP